jgi:hypothetical protein
VISNVEDCEYLSDAKNFKVKTNKIRNTAIGIVILEKSVDEYFEAALFTEARFK